VEKKTLSRDEPGEGRVHVLMGVDIRLENTTTAATTAATTTG
jgi:hypothetical protein